jgi:death-on-curing protein
MKDPRWLTLAMASALHRESIARFGGSDGVRDLGLLESALARPQNRHAYESEATVFALAADYCLGIVRNHPFLDGNKRTSILAASVFLSLNGYDFDPPEPSIVQMIVGIAAGQVDAEALTAWFEAYSRTRSG